MSLIPCPECQTSVSDQAKACPMCGHPISTINVLSVEGANGRSQAQLVELTAKRLKKHYVIAALICVLSMVLGFGSCIKANVDHRNFWAVDFFTLLFIAGFLYLLTIQFLIWWHHR